MRVYIAGPMRGYEGWNFPAFDAAEAAWRAQGHIAFSPAATDRALGYGPDYPSDRNHLSHVILADIAAILAADAVAVLPGWERSQGATVEVSLAQFLGLPIYDAATGDRVFPVTTPWAKAERVFTRRTPREGGETV